MNRSDETMYEYAEYGRPVFGILAVLLPLPSLFHARTDVRSVIFYLVFVFVVGTFYFCSSMVLRKLTLAVGESGSSLFHNIRAFVAFLTTLGLIMTMLAWVFAARRG